MSCSSLLIISIKESSGQLLSCVVKNFRTHPSRPWIKTEISFQIKKYYSKKQLCQNGILFVLRTLFIARFYSLGSHSLCSKFKWYQSSLLILSTVEKLWMVISMVRNRLKKNTICITLLEKALIERCVWFGSPGYPLFRRLRYSLLEALSHVAGFLLWALLSANPVAIIHAQTNIWPAFGGVAKKGFSLVSAANFQTRFQLCQHEKRLRLFNDNLCAFRRWISILEGSTFKKFDISPEVSR